MLLFNENFCFERKDHDRVDLKLEETESFVGFVSPSFLDNSME